MFCSRHPVLESDVNVCEEKSGGRLGKAQMRDFVMKYIEQEHPDVLESVKTSMTDEQISENKATNSFLTYESLCNSRGWDIFDKGNDDKIEKRIALGWLKKGTAVSKSEAALIDEMDLPRCAKFKYILTSVESSLTNRTRDAMCVAGLGCDFCLASPPPPTHPEQLRIQNSSLQPTACCKVVVLQCGGC
jgi:hypothetical protein